MSMKNIGILLQKQWKDTKKNKAVLLQFLLFPVMGLILTGSIKIPGMPEHFFGNLFGVMYAGMAPLTGVSAILSEEKEKNTLRALMMADVTMLQYLTGIGSFVFLACMLGSGVLCAAGGYQGPAALWYMLLLALGILISMVLGAVIGLWSKNQMAVTSITVPAMVVLSFLPMLSMFNEKIARAAKFVYSEQIRRLLFSLGDAGPDLGLWEILKSFGIIGGNFLIAAGIFFFASVRKK